MRILLLSEYSRNLTATPFIDANHIPREFLFKDAYHFNPTGAKIFTACLKEDLKAE